LNWLLNWRLGLNWLGWRSNWKWGKLRLDGLWLWLLRLLRLVYNNSVTLTISWGLDWLDLNGLYRRLDLNWLSRLDLNRLWG
jgi:hypothetical protein